MEILETAEWPRCEAVHGILLFLVVLVGVIVSFAGRREINYVHVWLDWDRESRIIQNDVIAKPLEGNAGRDGEMPGHVCDV